MKTHEKSPAQEMLALATSYQVSRALFVVAKLGIPDLLADGPRFADDLAAATKTNHHALYRILRCIAGQGVLEERPDRQFGLTPLGKRLCSDAPDSVRAYTIFCHEELFQCWGDIEEAVRTGEPRFERVIGVSRFAYLKSHPDAGILFHDAMADIERIELPYLVPALVEAIDATDAKMVVDVGGGHGTLLSNILAQRPALATVLLDLAPGIESARAGVGGPLPGCDLVVGDYFRQVPGGGDIYILQQILHIWPDDKCVTILENCRDAMAEGGRIMVVEREVGSRNVPSAGKLQDLNMMVVAGGMERTAEEFESLFQKANLRLTRETSTSSVYSIFEAVRTDDCEP